MRKLYAIVDQNKTLRSFAGRYIYSKEVYTDFFAVSFLLALQALVSVAFLFYWQVRKLRKFPVLVSLKSLCLVQIRYGTLPLWLIYAYYFEWVGLGGRGMGGAYTFAHKEGHHRNGGLYQPWIAKRIGNFWENWMGFWCVPICIRIVEKNIYDWRILPGMEMFPSISQRHTFICTTT